MATKVAMQFSYTLHICNQNIVFNIPMKNYLSSLKGSCMGNFALFFFQLYPTHSRSVYDSTGLILAILYSKVPHMLHAKIRLIGTVVLQKKSFERFLPYMGMAAILTFKS